MLSGVCSKAEISREEAMKILVFGAGVIGVVYAWQLSEAGQDVTLLVRPGRKQEIESKGIFISCLDKRGPRKHIETVYHPKLVEDFSPTDDCELILVCVKRNQLKDVLPFLAEKAGDADILFLQNNWSGTAEIEQYLTPSRFVLGFPSVGGGRDEHGIQCVLGTDTMLGEKDGQITPRLQKISGIMRDAGFKPKITRQIVPWLWTHYAEIAALVGAMYVAA
jgi:ketopantoate reductase